MKNLPLVVMSVSLSLGLVACGKEEVATAPETESANKVEVASGHKVDASGKEKAEIDTVPAEVIAAVMAARPGFEINETEYETRDGNEYYDVEGFLPDGSEIEMDMTRIDGVWTIVEFQRDIGIELTPDEVQAVLQDSYPDWQANRIIESDQGDGVIIYEFFGLDDAGEDIKIEVKWAEGEAELLVDEWVH